MSRRFPLAELAAFAGILAGGYVVVASSSGATTVAVATGDRQDSRPTAVGEAARPAAVAAPARSPARAPVPLQISRRTTYRVEAPEPPASATENTEQAERKVASGAAAKAMIEADGYKNVRSLVQEADGAWHGLAMRGAVEVPVSVAGDGSVSTQ